MDPEPRPNKLQKRKSRERQELTMSGGLSGQPANTSQPMAPSSNGPTLEERKKSKFRLSNPFHSKEKEKEKEKEKDNVKLDNTPTSTTDTKEHNPR
jgi:hypothetical protein